MKLSNQAIGALMMALQKSLMEQSDIVPVLAGMELVLDNDELRVTNPPIVSFEGAELAEVPDENEPLVPK